MILIDENSLVPRTVECIWETITSKNSALRYQAY